MERISFLPSYVYLKMQGRREIYEREKEGRKEETDDCLIYISVFQQGEEKVIYAKQAQGIPVVVRGICPACHRKTNLKGWNGIYECPACGMVRSEEEIIKESIKGWWL